MADYNEQVFINSMDNWWKSRTGFNVIEEKRRRFKETNHVNTKTKNKQNDKETASEKEDIPNKKLILDLFVSN